MSVSCYFYLSELSFTMHAKRKYRAEIKFYYLAWFETLRRFHLFFILCSIVCVTEKTPKDKELKDESQSALLEGNELQKLMPHVQKP